VDERLPAGVDAITWTATVADDGTSGRDPDPANNEAQASIQVAVTISEPDNTIHLPVIIEND
jgi:hypothetical protein